MKGPSKPFVLRLPVSIHQEAQQLAGLEGISLNQFITQALAEKLVRLENRPVRVTDKEKQNTMPSETIRR